MATRYYYIYIWLSLASCIFAQLQTFSPPGQNAITYSVNIPQSTVSSNSGPLYVQLKSTTPLQWFAWGQGSLMKGANLFVVYASSAGTNVTVSPRLGLVEHVEPTYNAHAQVSLLDGSGIRDGVITANIRCDSCITWQGGSADLHSSASPWVWAVRYGSALDSDSVSFPITIHDFSGVAELDLQRAVGGTSANPFLAGNTSTNGSSGVTITTTNTTSGSIQKRRIAHSVIMTVVFVVLFPGIALLLHVFPSGKMVQIHAGLQLVTLAFAIAGMGVGISLAKSLGLIGNYHPVIGMVAVPALILFQPAMGLLQHRYFHRTGKKGVFAYLHRWFGRCIILLGVINGGLGLHLARTTTATGPLGAIIPYSVLVGVLGVFYILAIGLFPRDKRGMSSI
ncbi:hypothetical protein FE257_002545 [Aspergillus nanangensis]|uniref:Integral membrane protein n=1 Tax=Aspergillus nanangensis TaxID=2582783 RepID=A0AAD4GVW7_ASPNN|nr:hypothetical protein FE257_002545 [Aspergillus nanangensis]